MVTLLTGSSLQAANGGNGDIEHNDVVMAVIVILDMGGGGLEDGGREVAMEAEGQKEMEAMGKLVKRDN
ncbi:hypothetical protein PHSC3_001328 [Chlamydiales bacterium STE3]|nr:hypothetical protein PHSC3_001328 [Chlamydiales bacterium STE3]